MLLIYRQVMQMVKSMLKTLVSKATILLQLMRPSTLILAMTAPLLAPLESGAIYRLTAPRRQSIRRPFRWMTPLLLLVVILLLLLMITLIEESNLGIMTLLQSLVSMDMMIRTLISRVMSVDSDSYTMLLTLLRYSVAQTLV